MIPIAKPYLDESEVDAVRRVIASGWVTQGREVAAFEREFADAVRSPYACAVSSGTAALHLALLAAGVGPGDEVVTVSHSFIATANAIRYSGARPVFVDIQPATFNMDPALIEPALTVRTRAVLCVHQMGMPCDMRAICDIAGRHELPVVEDAACATGSEMEWEGQWEPIGRPRGDIACFSFHPRKLVTTGDGGMITTRRSEWADRCRRWRQHGMSVSDLTRHSADGPVFESYLELGYNYRMTDIQAAVGREQLRRMPEMIARRRALAARYRHLLSTVSGIIVPEEPPWACSNWQSYCVRLPEGTDQRDIMQRMHSSGVATRRGIMCAHREPAYPRGTWACSGDAACDCPGGVCRRLQCSERAQDEGLLLPLFPKMTLADQDRVVAVLRAALRP